MPQLRVCIKATIRGDISQSSNPVHQTSVGWQPADADAVGIGGSVFKSLTPSPTVRRLIQEFAWTLDYFPAVSGSARFED